MRTAFKRLVCFARGTTAGSKDERRKGRRVRRVYGIRVDRCVEDGCREVVGRHLKERRVCLGRGIRRGRDLATGRLSVGQRDGRQGGTCNWRRNGVKRKRELWHTGR